MYCEKTSDMIKLKNYMSNTLTFFHLYWHEIKEVLYLTLLVLIILKMLIYEHLTKSFTGCGRLRLVFK